MVQSFPKMDKTRWCNFSWKLRLLNPPRLFGVIGSVMITLIKVNFLKKKMGKCNPRSSNDILPQDLLLNPNLGFSKDESTLGEMVLPQVTSDIT